jgi:hypothetical protein
MNMPPDILTFLLRGGIRNVEERKAKGLWPNEKLRYSEVLAHLVSVLQREEWFPRRMPDRKPGDLVCEGTVIQRIPPSRFVCYSRRPSVYDLHSVVKTPDCSRRAAAWFNQCAAADRRPALPFDGSHYFATAHSSRRARPVPVAEFSR